MPTPNRRLQTPPIIVARRSLHVPGISLLLLSVITFTVCLAWQYFVPQALVTNTPTQQSPPPLTTPVQPAPVTPPSPAPIAPPVASAPSVPVRPRIAPPPPIVPQHPVGAPPSQMRPIEPQSTAENTVVGNTSPEPALLAPPALDTTSSELPVPSLNSDPVTLNNDANSVPSEQPQDLKPASPPESIAFVAPNAYLGKVVRQVAVAPTDKVIALTFDDGPWPKSTLQVLDILKQHQIKATFFWIGLHLEWHPKIARQVVADGHVIGNHTWHHRYKPMTTSEAASEIDHTAQLMESIAGVKTDLFRPPGGRLQNGLAVYAEKTRNDAVVLWSVMPGDTNPSVSASEIVDKVLKGARPGGIVLLHDGGGDRKHTVQALPQIITALEKQGYRLVTIPELLEQAAPSGVAWQPDALQAGQNS